MPIAQLVGLRTAQAGNAFLGQQPSTTAASAAEKAVLANLQETIAVSADSSRQSPQGRIIGSERGKRKFWAVLNHRSRAARGQRGAVANGCVKSRKHRVAAGLPAATMENKSNHLP